MEEKDARQLAAQSLRWSIDPGDADLLVDFVAEHGTDTFPSALTSRVAERMVGQASPQAALEWASSLPTSLALDAQESVFQGWAFSNASNSTQAAAALPKGELRQRALSTTASFWLGSQEDAALSWIGTQPDEIRAEIRTAITENPYWDKGAKNSVLEKIQ